MGRVFVQNMYDSYNIVLKQSITIARKKKYAFCRIIFFFIHNRFVVIDCFQKYSCRKVADVQWSLVMSSSCYLSISAFVNINIESTYKKLMNSNTYAFHNYKNKLLFKFG